MNLETIRPKRYKLGKVKRGLGMKSYQRGKIIGDNSNLKIPYGTKGKTIKRLTLKVPIS